METILLGLLAILVTAAFFFAKDFNDIGSKRHMVARVVVALLAIVALTSSTVFMIDMFVLVENNNQCVS